MDFPGSLHRWDNWMQARLYSPKTRHDYRLRLTWFWCDYLALLGLDPVTATEAVVLAYIASLPAQGSTRGDAIRAVKCYYGWMMGRDRPDNPARELKVHRPKLTKAPDITDDDLNALFDAAFRRGDRRGHAMMLCYATGARVTSLCALERRDLDLAQGVVHFRHTKGDRPYDQPMNGKARAAASGLLTIGLDPVVGVGAARFRQWVHEAEADAGLDRVWPHLLRHAFSNRVARAGDVEAWRRSMNHVDLSQWTRYNVADENRVRDAQKEV